MPVGAAAIDVDIALIRLSAEQSAALASVPVARTAATSLPLAPANYAKGEMAGWGLTRFGGQLSNDLLSTSLKITAVGPPAIMVRSQNGAGPCIGDCGGPLYGTEADGTLPSAFNLQQNYPNPSNPETVLRFDLPASVEVGRCTTGRWARKRRASASVRG